ncbi:MAG: 4Fe-4S dicluster domain-containing protein [Methanosarcinaceae archaeon]|nr:4Fe-4S dicluster domain-containing protein [Methanosarcinaceae archaeon]
MSEKATGTLSGYDTPECETLAEIVKRSLRTSDSIGIDRCIQCGACTASCPAARFTDYNPREIVKRVMENDCSVIGDETIWNCFYCYTCHLRCPRNNSPSQVVQVLRQLSINEGTGLDKIDMLFEYGIIFAEIGVSKLPPLFFEQMETDFDEHWLEFKENLDEVRSELGLGPIGIRDNGRGEIRAILEGTGFFERVGRLEQTATTETDSKQSFRRDGK